jgi:hypothetical protein
MSNEAAGCWYAGTSAEKLDHTKLICLWTVPRSCSTAFERSVMNRTDMEYVHHEPLSIPYYWGPKEKRGSKRYADEPERESFEEKLEEMKKSKEEAGNGQHVFSKDMAYYLTGPDGTVDEKLLEKVVDEIDVHTFLIKNPIRQVPSLHRMSTEETETIGWSEFDPKEVGYREMKVLMDAVQKKEGKVPVIVDADELLEDPSTVLESYCSAIGLPFEEERMLSWDSTDPEIQKKFRDWKGWHDHAIQSTGWGKANNGKRKKPLTPEAQEEVDEAIAAVQPIYQEMYEKRLKA